MKKIAIYPGSFDPVTCGHVDIITRSSNLFDKLIVAVLRNSSKKSAFSIEQRKDFLRRALCDVENVEVDSFDGLLVEYARVKNALVIVRGLRAMSDFEHEFQMALTNKKMRPSLETIFMTTTSENLFLSSSVVREIARYGGNLKGMVPDCIHDDILNSLNFKF